MIHQLLKQLPELIAAIIVIFSIGGVVVWGIFLIVRWIDGAEGPLFKIIAYDLRRIFKLRLW